MKLHIGCGKKDFGEDWIHIDGSDYPHIKYHDITKLPFSDNSVSIIYACHVFEYFDRDEAVTVLKEWRRVLKEGGKLRLAVPDFEQVCNLYQKGEITLDHYVGMLYGKWAINENTYVYHKTCYDYKSLSTLLTKCKFINVHRWNWREVDHGKFDDYSQAYYPHMDKDNGVLVSLNVECIK